MNLTFLMGLLTGEAADAVDRARRSVFAYVLAGFCVLFGSLFLLVAAFIFVSENLRYGPLTTALVFGAFFIAIALLVLLYHRLRASTRARRTRERRQGDMRVVATGALVAALPTLLARGGLKSLALPVLAAAAYAIYRENSKPKDESD